MSAAPAKRGRGRKPEGPRSLTSELSAFLTRTLVPDLKARAAQPAVRRVLERRHAHEKAARRTAEAFATWVDRLVEQVAAAWALSCVFVRTLEDRGLLDRRRIAGEGADDSERLFDSVAPHLTPRDYLLTVFRELSKLPGAADIMDARHNPVWRLAPSAEGARALLEFFRQTDDAGQLVFCFEGTDTRLLGDLYQHLSEDIRERYALLQTPRFVERFILDQTLEPAIREFGLEEVRVIDPTCGSGHFLLGAFERLFEHRQRLAPGLDPRQHALAALAQVHGVDLNPYAVAIARFRLTLAFLDRAGIRRIAQAPRLPLNLVVADSLLHGGLGTTRRLSELTDDRRAWGDQLFDLEDAEAAAQVFSKRYHAVVGNPPYITCKDDALREAYRELYASAAGKFALAAPFTERFFQLGVDGGFIGLINANSFMKREFGKKLIEEVLPHVDLTRLIDTAGAFIPGHGTPTVLLFGRNRRPLGDKVRAVLGKRGEPSAPDVPEVGHVWSSIARHFDAVGYEDDYISVADMSRVTFGKHPWSMGGGGAAELKALLEQHGEKRVEQITASIGFMAIPGEDDAYLADSGTFSRHALRPVGTGEDVRDWSAAESMRALFPYSDNWAVIDDPAVHRWLWPFRSLLASRLMFGKTQVEAGLQWFEYRHIGREKVRTPSSIAFAEVATHNHFVLDRGGRVFKQTAPIIKLAETATEDEHLALLGYLNSSTACFWMKQVCHPKSNAGQRHHPDPARFAFAFNSSAIAGIPVPALAADLRLVSLSKELCRLGEERARTRRMRS